MTGQTAAVPRRCTATSRSGEQCKRRPIPGGTVCSMHGGKSPAVQRKAAERLAMEQAARDVAEWGGRLDVTPPEALMELVQTKAAEVAYWNAKVAGLTDAERAGLLVAKTAHVFLTMLHKAQDQLAAYSAAAVRVGVDEALIKVASVQAPAIIDLARQAVAAARLEPSMDADSIILRIVEATASREPTVIPTIPTTPSVSTLGKAPGRS